MTPWSVPAGIAAIPWRAARAFPGCVDDDSLPPLHAGTPRRGRGFRGLHAVKLTARSGRRPQPSGTAHCAITQVSKSGWAAHAASRIADAALGSPHS